MNEREAAHQAWLIAKAHAEALDEAARAAERYAVRMWARYVEFENPRVAAIVQHALREGGYL